MKFTDQINYLPDEDLIILYSDARELLSKRKLLGVVDKALNVNKSIFDKESRPVVLEKKGKINKCYSLKNESILFDFLEEDWSHLFNQKYDESNNYYVYYHTNPHYKESIFINKDEKIVFNGKPFYVGKGTGNRYKQKNRSRPHLELLNSLEEVFLKDEIYHIFKDNLTERQALELESKLINFFGCESELSTNNIHFHGHLGGWLINTDYSIRPDHVSNSIKLKFSNVNAGSKPYKKKVRH